MLNVLLIRPGEQPAAVTVPENAVALTETAVRALIGAANTERHPGLWAGVIGDLYTDAKAVAQNMPVNDAASELRAAAIRHRNPASKDAAVLRGAAVLVQTMPGSPAAEDAEDDEPTADTRGDEYLHEFVE